MVRVISETLLDGSLYETPVLERRLDAADAADGDLFLAFNPGEGGGGGLLLGGVGAPDTYVPLLIVDDEPETGAPFPIGDGDGDESGGLDVFGGGGGGSESFVSLILEIQLDRPGLPPGSSDAGSSTG